MSDILDDTTSAPTGTPRTRGWRQGPVAAGPEPGVELDDESSDLATAPGSPRNVGPFVAAALLIAAGLIVALAVVTVTAGTSDAPDAQVAGVVETNPPADDRSPLETEAPVSTEVVDSSVPAPTPTASTVPRNPIELEPGALVLTTFYREVPLDGGEFSVAVRLENEGDVDFAIADVEFEFEVGGEVLPVDELITVHARVPAGGSAVVTIRVSLPPVVGTPELVVSAVNGELARAVLP